MHSLLIPNISGLTANSKSVRPGYLFAALPGYTQDGTQYINEAIERGAIAVLSGSIFKGKIPYTCLITDLNPRQRFARMLADFYHSQPETIAAVTGTNGKTSVVAFAYQIWKKLGLHADSLGTLGTVTLGITDFNGATTPDPEILYSTLANLKEHRIKCLALEASSHGLDQFRLDGINLAAAAFTNLGRDHLDYHGSLSLYKTAKKRLFCELLPKGAPAILNADDPTFEEFRMAAKDANIFSYGFNGLDFRIVKIVPTKLGQRLDLQIHGHHFTVLLPLVGTFQAMNALCALGLVIALGADRDAAVSALETLESVPGRLQLVATLKNDAPVYVDYAHTPNALESLLETLHSRGHIKVVLGCGGNRDYGKRSYIGSIAVRFSNEIVVTDDNPRYEMPRNIRANIQSLFLATREINDRSTAIQTVISRLQKDDTLVIVGKGHEQVQIFGTTSIPFDDTIACVEAIILVDSLTWEKQHDSLMDSIRSGHCYWRVYYHR